MENGSNVSALSHDEINNKGSDLLNSEDNVIQGIHPFLNLHSHFFLKYINIYTINFIAKLYISTYSN